MSFTVDKAGRAHALQVESFQPDSVAVARIWARKVLHGVKLSRFRLRIGPHGPMATEGFSYVYRFHYQPKD